MPNMLVHMGLQGIATGALVRNVDPRWVFLGCVLPDVPWILQRLGHALLPGLNPYTLRLYAVTQASLAFSLLLCAAVALWTTQPGKIWRVLALNAVFHLLLDACETKWANGVHLLAPFSWGLLNFGFVWPESWLVQLLTIFGLMYGVRAWWHRPAQPAPASPAPFWQRPCATLLVVAYMLLPLALRSGPYAMDNHSIKTLQERELRAGRHVEFDRNLYRKHPSGDRLHTFAREELYVIGQTSTHSGLASVRGTFVDATTIRIDALHMHWNKVRDFASYLGLALLVVLWVGPSVRYPRRSRNTL